MCTPRTISSWQNGWCSLKDFPSQRCGFISLSLSHQKRLTVCEQGLAWLVAGCTAHSMHWRDGMGQGFRLSDLWPGYIPRICHRSLARWLLCAENALFTHLAFRGFCAFTTACLGFGTLKWHISSFMRPPFAAEEFSWIFIVWELD